MQEQFSQEKYFQFNIDDDGVREVMCSGRGVLGAAGRDGHPSYGVRKSFVLLFIHMADRLQLIFSADFSSVSSVRGEEEKDRRLRAGVVTAARGRRDI